LIRKEFESLGIDYTREDVLKVNAAKANSNTPLENDAINFDEMSNIVLNKSDSNKSESHTPKRRQSKQRRPSLCRKEELTQWVDTVEGRDAAKQLEQDMIKELARLSTQALNLSPKERIMQEERLIVGLTQHQDVERKPSCKDNSIKSEWLEGVQTRLVKRIRRASLALIPRVESGGYGPQETDEEDSYSRSESELSEMES